MIISMPNHVANPQQLSQDNMKGARPHNEGTNDLRPSNLYYDQGNVKQTFHSLVGLQTANENIHVQRGQVTHPPKEMVHLPLMMFDLWIAPPFL